MIVIRDCTGTYLRINGKDNPVCNYKIISNFDDGTTISATYKKVGNSKCEDRNNPHCTMVHPGELGEWVEIIKVK